MKKLNNKGSILQIVLVVFLTMCFALTLSLSLMNQQSSQYQLIEKMMKQKNLEIMLVHYYCEQVENNILLSDYYEESDYEIHYTVDDMGDYYEVITTVYAKEMNYGFLVWINAENANLLKFEYMEDSL